MENIQKTRENGKDFIKSNPTINDLDPGALTRLEDQDLSDKQVLSKPSSSQNLPALAKSTSDINMSDREARRSRKLLDPVKKQDLSLNIKKSNFDTDMNPNAVGERPASSKTVLERLKDNIAASKAEKTAATVESDVNVKVVVANAPENLSIKGTDAESTTDITKKKKSSKKKKKGSTMVQSATDTDTEVKKKKRSARSPEYYAALEKQLDELAVDESPVRLTPGPKNTPVTIIKSSIKSELPESPRKSRKKPVLSPEKSEPQEIPILFAHLQKTLQDFKDMILSVYIHKSDSLDSNVYLQHPLVKISLLDQDTGMYLSKSSKSRKVTYAHDPVTISYIMPIITKPFSLNENKTKAPIWDEQLVLNELYTHILKPKTLIFFEIIDFVTNVKALEVYPDGWNKIAWSFLRLVGSDGRATTESKARLQLYKYPKVLPKVPKGIPVVYYCWKRKWEKYPSTLYVKVAAHQSLEMVKVTSRPVLPNQIESGKVPWDIVRIYD